ncbi:MAG: hypothetical protein A2Z99_15465 [Treponema sp. GWB1_62_6]|nr:MAG: hypothetical protein A2Y36_16470 [Treponema sp. GWA1_62_8]OHE62649.1 MAG: hypothetical protein A2001_21105 [Treponema sp. GWC1_61_84]OHE71553.1 MAG: hypothetical protein A2Z99_15465 [Treponema sp. GWB1_62_6]OHE76127.1 MAG: hypothetical protein A2413_13950 [Treponema sp. RIFOXYC1_FULL_61_9]HCM26642.1 hypothetical protein [Treponema sp.]
MRAVLYVDDQEEELQALRFQLAERYRIIPCPDGSLAAALVAREQPSAVILDLEMPGYDGFKVLSDITALGEHPPVLMLSGHSDAHFVSRAIKSGASWYMSKPYHHSMVRKQLDRIIAKASAPAAAASACSDQKIDSLIGSSAVMASVRADIAAYAPSNCPVLIVGESGTGKDLAARSIHRLSARSDGPFEVRNIAAFPESLAESELFGSDAGAFTGAKQRKGCFEEADGGTLFLDEIGEACATAQAALLRVVEDGLVRRLGATRARRIDCRLVCATNRTVDALTADRGFRSDLLYRLDILRISMPPLREHREDIAELVEFFLAGRKDRRTPARERIPAATLEKLVLYDWPGNVRQLRACMERAQALSRGGPIKPEHLRF